MNKLLALVLLAIPVFAGAATRQSAVSDMQKMTVLVTNEGFLGNGRGTGVLLSSTTVLTCAHMTAGPEDEFFVYTYPLGRVVAAHLVFYDRDRDLMVLGLSEPVEAPATPVFQGSTYDGEPITVIGNALGSMKWIVSGGVISGRERGYLLTDARLNPGNSGGPWLNDQGEIVALTDWGIGPHDQTPGIAGGVSGLEIKRFLTAYRLYQAMSPIEQMEMK